MTHRGRQARRLVYKKRTPVTRTGKTRHVRVAGRGLQVVGRAAVGTAAVAVAGAYLTTRWTVRHSYRGYRAARPHVNRVAGHAGRYLHTRGMVYSDATARRIVRMQARNRVRVRRMRYAAATRLSELHTRSIQRDWSRITPVAARAAAAVAPRTGRVHPTRQLGVFTGRSSSAGRRAEDEAIRRAAANLADAAPSDRNNGGASASRGGVGTLDRPGSAPKPASGVRVEPSAHEDAAVRRAQAKLAGLGDVDLGRTPTGDPDKEARKAGLPEATPGVWQQGKPDVIEPPKPQRESAEDKQKRRELENHKPLRPDGFVPGWVGQRMEWDYVLPPENKRVHRTDSGRQPTQAKAERIDTAKTSSSGAPAKPSTAPKTTSISTTGGNMSNNPAAELNRGFALLADYHPESYQDWMQQLAATAHSLRTGAESVTLLAHRMDIQYGMDPRSLQKIYLAGPVIGSAMQLFAGATKDFWVLYQDRFEVNGARGRTMRDESTFFGQH
ncbi:hypothetical protein [Amycolatopsis sp. NPDC004378]